jgi:murein DD-endopeptidase MepM/ murein hydrolase activator NlpD
MSIRIFLKYLVSFVLVIFTTNFSFLVNAFAQSDSMLLDPTDFSSQTKISSLFDEKNLLLTPILGVLGSLKEIDTQLEAKSSDDTTYYRTKAGDSWEKVATLFKLSITTLKTANPNIKVTSNFLDQTLLSIPPINGIPHKVAKNENLEEIASRYDVSVEEIIDFNYLLDEQDIIKNQILFIPNGDDYVKSKELRKVYEKEKLERAEKLKKEKLEKERKLSLYAKTKSRFSKIITSISGNNEDENDSAGETSNQKSMNFLLPTGGRFSRGYGADNGRHKGIDIAAPIGTPIRAAASGVVKKATNVGYSGGYGIMAVLDHGGLDTLYGHMSRIVVQSGDHVNRGDIIGYVGSTGRSTGPHLHLEVRSNGHPIYTNLSVFR